MPAKKGNSYAVGNSGKSKKWKSAKELEQAIEEYFEECDEHTVKKWSEKIGAIVEVPMPRPYTIQGLCLVIDCDRKTLLNYEKAEGYEEYFHTIKKAKLRIEENKIERGLNGTSNSAVTIFDLKNNHDHKDKIEVANSGDLNVNFNEE